jgi:hypothetical protein
MVFNATFNNISVILWRTVLMVEESGVPGENNMYDADGHNIYGNGTKAPQSKVP